MSASASGKVITHVQTSFLTFLGQQTFDDIDKPQRTGAAQWGRPFVIRSIDLHHVTSTWYKSNIAISVSNRLGNVRQT